MSLKLFSPLERLRQEHSEALRLRAEIAGTHQAIHEFSRARADEKWKRSAFSSPVLHVATEVGEPFSANGYFPAEGWANVGAATPESSLQTALASTSFSEILWSASSRDSASTWLVAWLLVSSAPLKEFPEAEQRQFAAMKT